MFNRPILQFRHENQVKHINDTRDIVMGKMIQTKGGGNPALIRVVSRSTPNERERKKRNELYFS
jgi:hypothetical protein